MGRRSNTPEAIAIGSLSAAALVTVWALAIASRHSLNDAIGFFTVAFIITLFGSLSLGMLWHIIAMKIHATHLGWYVLVGTVAAGLTGAVLIDSASIHTGPLPDLRARIERLLEYSATPWLLTFCAGTTVSAVSWLIRRPDRDANSGVIPDMPEA